MDRYFQNVLIEFTERWRRVGKKKRKSERRRRTGYEREILGEGKKQGNDGPMFCNI